VGVCENGIRGRQKTCATSLFYDYLLDGGKITSSQALEEFIDLVRQYDTWEWEQNNNPTAKRLNDLFSIVGREEFEKEIFDRLSTHQDAFSFSEFEEKILELEEKKIERYIRAKNRRMVQTFVKDYCVGIVHAESYHSELGNELNKRNPHLDLIVILNVGNKSMGFRTIYDHVDVSEFAKQFGGGGHPKASGCGLTEETFQTFVTEAFPLVPRRPEPDKNDLNLQESPYGTAYINRNEEQFIIRPEESNQWSVFHKGEKLNTFDSYAEAERFLKRTYEVSLQFDNDLLSTLSKKLNMSEEKLKQKYAEIAKSL
jgi:oligoribonuclease NrnB/cAMP/cGMP phosphodiesterase (DHH superfamily)